MFTPIRLLFKIARDFWISVWPMGFRPFLDANRRASKIDALSALCFFFFFPLVYFYYRRTMYSRTSRKSPTFLFPFRRGKKREYSPKVCPTFVSSWPPDLDARTQVFTRFFSPQWKSRTFTSARCNTMRVVRFLRSSIFTIFSQLPPKKTVI